MKQLLLLLTLVISFLHPEDVKLLPNGRRVVHSYDRLQAEETFAIKDEQDHPLFAQQAKYDASTRDVTITSHIYTPTAGRHSSQKIIQRYDSSNRLLQDIRMPGTEWERVTTYTYTPSGQVKNITWPDKRIVYYEYDEDDYVISIKSSDKSIYYQIEYLENKNIYTNLVTAQKVVRSHDSEGRIASEIFPSSHEVKYAYGSSKKLITLSKFGHIEYEDVNGKLIRVSRYSDKGAPLYSHTYHWSDHSIHDEDLICNLGRVSYDSHPIKKYAKMSSPYAEYSLSVNSRDQLDHVRFDEKTFHYKYDKLNYLIESERYDSVGNPSQAKVNPLNELQEYNGIRCKYDFNGNLILKKTLKKTYNFTYDALNRLTSVTTDDSQTTYNYDIFNRRLSKTVNSCNGTSTEHYLYQDNNEVAIVDAKGNLIALRVPGVQLKNQPPRYVAFETPEGTFAPIYDHAYHVRKLINTNDKSIHDYTTLDPYAKNIRELNPIIPWIYFGKHYDSESGLIHYGLRYYDPSLKRWITPDPSGPIDSINLYLYLRNNPIKNWDSDGNFALSLPVVVWGARGASFLVPGLAPVIWGLTAGVLAYQTGKIVKTKLDERKEEKRLQELKEQANKKKPPYDGFELGNDPTKQPAKDFQWKGKGNPGSKEGSWVKGEGSTKEILYPDLEHPGPIGPHWDYTGPDFRDGTRLYPDGTWEYK
ncbi:MAG: hypothetical protein K9M07_03295 [Simkaniaceae bacterium]|nr:hypothetical protein [Simkaniaceae bacterium]MCF7852249.1 hypothetical protein [Simkaniaceae bacterium]